MPGPSDDDLTIGATAAPTRAPASRGDRTPTPSHGFAPGSVIAGRYRLVAMLGRGGMGEVYRADDLTLDHPVALKFLPAGVTADADRLAQFHAELRIARQVSHKNVCRLYDLGDADGRRFLTMEYVDGEDLASLLRRIGRIPQDKAIDIARQLCAGLAAAHERGVLHRDLKPANVMIDGDGNVRIADFGLAVAAGDTMASRAGTPQYMAPEQLSGGQASVKTDIYALGLVLFELFTGRRAYEAKTLNELVALQQSSTISTPSSVVRDLDPAIERVILRCLERDPALRPGSALAVSAALPGGDPLAAALAAGETPSPEMLAAAGAAEALPVAKGLAAVAWVVAGLLVLAGLSTTASVPGLVPLDKPPAVLIDRAEQILATFGYTDKAADSAYDFTIDADYLRWLSRQDRTPRRYEALRIGSPAAVMLWYRTSPRALITFGPSYKVTPIDPPLAVPGMTLVVLDTFGRLQQFRAVPPQIDTDSPPQSPQWDTLFVAAGLPMSTFAAVTPTWMPRDFADTRAAWEGPVPERPDLRVRVEMAAYRGRPVSFLLIGPWTQANRTQAITRTTTQTVLRSFFVVVAFAILVGAMLIAWHHLRTSRADLRGATRLSLWMLGSFAVEWVVANHHIADIAIEWSGFGRWLGGPLLESAIVWVVYLAVEPYVRRFWPDGILGWTRLFAGHIRDPRVGRDVLLGCTFGVLLALVQMATLLVPPLFGATAGPRSFGTNLSALIGPSAVVVTFINVLWSDVVMSLFAVMAIVLLRLIFRRPRLAAAVFVLVLAVIQMQNVLTYTGSLWAVVVWEIVLIVAITVLLLRFGLLVLAVSFFIGETLGAIPLTLAASRWWAAGSNITLIALIAFVCFGFYASRAGQPLLGITET